MPAHAMPTKLTTYALSALLLSACLAAPDAPAESIDQAERAATSAGAQLLDLTREVVTSDIVHYSALIAVGDTPNAKLRLHRVVRERAPWLPRAGGAAVLLLHGDFATFESNFAPSLSGDPTPPERDFAVYLAGRGVDVWGMDRRWASTTATDFSDYQAMGYDAVIADVEHALGFARVTRALTGAGGDRLILGGFSSGGHIAYAVASAETQKPRSQRNVRALLALDVSARIDPADEALRLAACARRDEEQGYLDAGYYAGENGYFVDMGNLALTAPDDPSPIFAGYTNQGVIWSVTGFTWQIYQAAPAYHLLGNTIVDETSTGLRFTENVRANHWFAAAPPFQSMRESLEMDAILCGEGPLPAMTHLGDVEIPLFYLGAAGGYGAYGLYSTTLVKSKDVQHHIVQQLPAAQEGEDYGHGDLLYGVDARQLAWKPTAEWILRH